MLDLFYKKQRSNCVPATDFAFEINKVILTR